MISCCKQLNFGRVQHQIFYNILLFLFNTTDMNGVFMIGANPYEGSGFFFFFALFITLALNCPPSPPSKYSLFLIGLQHPHVNYASNMADKSISWHMGCRPVYAGLTVNILNLFPDNLQVRKETSRVNDFTQACHKFIFY